MTHTFFDPPVIQGIKADGYQLRIILPADYVNRLHTGINVCLGYLKQPEGVRSFANAAVRSSPCGNCGMMELSFPNSFYLDVDQNKKFLLWIESFARRHCRSVLQGNDGVDKSTWRYIQNHGTDYNFVECGYNRNYDMSSPHKVGLYWKDVGAHEYLAQDFGWPIDFLAREKTKCA